MENGFKLSPLDDLPDTGPVAIIDADSLLYFEMNKPTYEEAIEGIIQRLLFILTRCNTSRYIAFLTKSRCFRYDIAKTKPYKGNRTKTKKKRPPIFYALSAYVEQNLNFIYYDNLEADDLVSVVNNKIENSIICSCDKDVLYQNSGIHYDYRQANFITVNDENAEKFLWKQVLMGDASDGVPGIPKIGTKLSEQYLEECKNKDYSSHVFKKYTEKFGNVEGICKFVETFKLVYILKSEEDILRELGVELKVSDIITNIIDVKHLNTLTDACEM